MKLCTALIFAAIFQVHAAVYGQTVSLHVSNVPVRQVIDEISKQSGYEFLYNVHILDNAPAITVKVDKATLEQALKLCFAGQAYDYTIKDKTVILVKKEKSFLEKVKEKINAVIDQSLTVNGLVTNIYNEPLAGATVLIKQTKLGVITDAHGFYTIKNLASTDTLVISFLGYQTMFKPVGKGGFINVKLQEATSKLDEVVVQAYGRTSQRTTTGNIGRITALDIAKEPVNDPLLALEGRIPGVVVTPESGYNGGPVKIQIRGRSTMNLAFSSEPLYIIDGVPLTILDVSQRTNTQAYASGTSLNYVSRGTDQTNMSYSLGQSPLFSINPTDIESIEVLKDADATAIYGSRGANGVVLITTKKGKPGASQLDIGVQDGANFATRFLPMLHTPDYLQLRRTEFKNDGITPTAANAPDLFLWDPNAYTDWQKYAYGGVGNRLNTQASLSGGTDQTTFRISGGYNQTKNITAVSGADRRATMALSLVNTSANKRLITTMSVNYGYTNLNQLNLTGISNLPPNAPSVYTAAGTPNFLDYSVAGLTSYPFSSIMRPYSSSGNALTTNLNLQYTVFKGFTATASLGYTNNQNSQTLIIPVAAQSPYSTTPPKGSLTEGNTKVTNWIFEPQLSYNRLISKGRFTALAGATIQKNSTDGLTLLGTNYADDSFIHAITQAPTLTSLENYGQYKYAGAFARIGYDWEGKYILNFNGRRDGSSRFGPGKQFGNFGSAGAAWILSDENWAKEVLPKAVDFIKLRASYGITGSDAVRDYQYLAQFGNSTPILTSYNGVTPLSPQLSSNPDFHWQVNKKLDADLNVELWNGLISLDVDYYQNRCDNQLVSLVIPEITGFTSVTGNSPANVQNAGWEFMVNTNFIASKNFSWRQNFNIAINHNKLLSYPGLATSPYRNQYKVGQSINTTYLFNYAGIDPLTGLYTYTDHSGDGKLNNTTAVFPGTLNDDEYIAINREPDFTGGLTEVFNYKRLQLTLNINFAKQMGNNLVNGGSSNAGGTSVVGLSNIAVFVYQNEWQSVGQTNALYARASTSPIIAGTVNSSNAGWSDASYIRFQTVTLNYALPTKILSKIGVRSLGLSVSSNNLFVLTAYKGFDPEITTFGGQPPVRTITAGINATF